MNRWQIVVDLLVDASATGRRLATMLEALPFARRFNWCDGAAPPIGSPRWLEMMSLTEERRHE